MKNGKRGFTGKHLTGRIGPLGNGWKGGRYIGPYGYVYVWVGMLHPMHDSKGYAVEHRLVMASHLGRSLTSDELVHHRNEIKTDNSLANLELTDRKSHPSRHITWDRKEMTCERCGKQFTPPRKPRAKRVLCSRTCRAIRHIPL